MGTIGWLPNNSAFTLTNCVPPTFDSCVFRNNSNTTHGGAINATGVTGKMTLNACTFVGNTATGHGGAVRYNANTTGAPVLLTVDACLFEGNTANPAYVNGNFVGGALWLESGDSMIRQTIFRGNRANARCTGSFGCNVLGRGGAIYVGAGMTTLEAAVFSGNIVSSSNGGRCSFGGSTQSHGGAVYVAGGGVTIANCVFARNSTSGTNCGYSDAGGGLFVNAGTVNVTNSTFARNADSTGLHLAGGTLDVTNSIIFFNNGNGTQVGGAPNITYSDVQGTVVYTGTGNINFNPVFGGPLCEIVRLGSPCIDAGDPAPVSNDACVVSPTHPFGPAMGGPRNDMGAHGGPFACSWHAVTPWLQLSASPEPLTTPGDLTFTLAGGDPRTPFILTLCGACGIAMPGQVIFGGIFCAERREQWTVRVPRIANPLTLDFQAFALDSTSNFVTADKISVTLQ